MKAGLGTPESKIWYKKKILTWSGSKMYRLECINHFTVNMEESYEPLEQQQQKADASRQLIPGHLGIKRQCLISSTSCQAAAVKGRKEKERKLQDELEVRNHTHAHTHWRGTCARSEYSWNQTKGVARCGHSGLTSLHLNQAANHMAPRSGGETIISQMIKRSDIADNIHTVRVIRLN